MRKVLLMLCIVGAVVYAARDAEFTWSDYVTIPLGAKGSVRISPIALDSSANNKLLVDGAPAVGWTRSNPMWDSRRVADGWHELTLTGENVTVNILVVNNAVVHNNTLTKDESWKANVSHVVWGAVNVPDGKTLTVAKDAEVYYTPGARICLLGGTFEAEVSSEPVSLNCAELVFHEGTLATDETWRAGLVHVVRSQLYIPAGRKLTIADGATVHFLENTGFRVDGTVVYGNGLHFILDDTAIAANAFNGNTGLSRVTLSSGLASIGANAFACANLELMVMACERPPTVSGELCPGGASLLLVPETTAWLNVVGTSWVFHGADVAYQEGMFAYRVLPNGNALYLGYYGEGNAPAVPETLNGHPVVFEQAVTLVTGWNFISPTILWNEQSAGQLASPIAFDAKSQGYVKAHGVLAAGTPLWVYCHDAAELTMCGRPADKVWTLGLKGGWNCVGAAKNVPTLPAKATAWEWTQGGYAKVTGGLKAGKAYWVFVE